MEDDCDETEPSNSPKLKISKISLKRSTSEEWNLNETKKIRRDSSDEISSRASSSGLSSIFENNERKRNRSEIKDGGENKSDKTFVNEGNIFKTMASEMQDMRIDNYLDIKIYCKDGSTNANSFLTGLAFFELRGIGELVGRDLIIPDVTVKELTKKLKNILVSLGRLKCKLTEEKSKTPELGTSSAECQSEYVPVEDEQTGGLTGFLPADEASPMNTKDLIDSKDESMERKETNKDQERKVPTKKTAALKKKFFRPTCKKCLRRNFSLMDFFHHSPCNDVKENTCIVCNKTVESKKFKGHLKWNKKCYAKLRQKFYKERNAQSELSKIKISKKVTIYQCKKCDTDFRGKGNFIQHKCLCINPDKCKYCDKPLENNRKAKHFCVFKKCGNMLKAEKVDKDSIKSISTITYLRPNYKNSDTGKSSKNKENLEKDESTNETTVSSSQKPENSKCLFTPNKEKVIKKKYFICKKCEKLFRGKAGFTHHKCWCSDPSKCKYCDKPFENITKKAEHFHRSAACRLKLKAESVVKKILSKNNPAITKNSYTNEVQTSQLNSKKGGRVFLCKYCRLSFNGKAAFTHHECLSNNPTRCKYCKREFEGDRKSVHFHNIKTCHEKLQAENVDEHTTSVGHFPRPKNLTCDGCDTPFTGYVSYYQHKCKFVGPKTKCRICSEDFDDYKRFSDHFSKSKGRKCKLEYLEMIKRDFPVVMNPDNSTNDADSIGDKTSDEDHSIKEKSKESLASSRIPRTKGLTCNDCENEFNGFVDFYQHECKFIGPKDKCRFCGSFYEDQTKLKKHLTYRQNCKSGFIQLIQSDFPESFDEADDDVTENVTANADDEIDCNISCEGIDESKSLASTISNAGKIPRPKGLTCTDCGIKFSGYIAYYQHQCKFSGTKGQCRYCNQVFEDQKRFTKHLHYRPICRNEFSEMIKRDFPEAFNEENDDTANVAAIPEVENPNVENLPSQEKFPKPTGLICKDCETQFNGYIPYFKHECKFNEHKGKCWFCQESFEDENKFGKHLYRTLKCRNGLIKMIERDFPEAGDEETDDPNDVTANPDVENKPATHNQDNMQSNEKISRARVYICNECGNKFHGYVTYCQHQCKFDGPQGLCRFCEQVYENPKKFSKHLHYRPTCKSKFAEIIKRDFPSEVKEIVDPTVIAKVEKDYAKYVLRAKLNNFKLELPRKSKNISQIQINEAKAVLENMNEAEHVSNKIKSTSKQKSKKKIKIEEEEYYELRIPSPLPGTEHIIEMDNGEEDLELDENEGYNYQHFSIDNEVTEGTDKSLSHALTLSLYEQNIEANNSNGDVAIDDVRSIEIEGNVCEDIDESLLEEEALEESMDEGGIVDSEDIMDTEDMVEQETTEESNPEDGLVDEVEGMDEDDRIGGVTSINAQDDRRRTEESNYAEDIVDEETTQESNLEEGMDEGLIISGEANINTEDRRIAVEESKMVEEKATEERMVEVGRTAKEESINAERLDKSRAAEVDKDTNKDIMEEKTTEGSTNEGGKEDTEENKGTDKVVRKWEDFLKQLEENNREYIIKDCGLDSESSSDEELSNEDNELENGDVCIKNAIIKDCGLVTESSFDEELSYEDNEMENGDVENADVVIKNGGVENKNGDDDIENGEGNIEKGKVEIENGDGEVEIKTGDEVGDVDFENASEESFEEESIELDEAEFDELEDGEMVTVEYKDCITSTNHGKRLREFLAENQITAHNISFKDMDYTNFKHTASFKVSQEDMKKIQKEDIKPEKDCTIHILNHSSDL